MDVPTLEDLAQQAVAGDRVALTRLLSELRAPVFALAVRMLWRRADAEDATQEILIRVITRLGQFDFQSRLKTWVYRVASNYLLDVKKSCVERQNVSFGSFAAELARPAFDDSTAAEPATDPEHSLLVEEVKVGCTLGMLQCLDRAHRLAYVFGEILELPAPEAAKVLELEPAAFRKRLQRARDAVESFTRAHCGLVSDAAPCRCDRRVPEAIRLGRITQGALDFASAGTSFADARNLIRRVEDARRSVELQRSAQPGCTALDLTPVLVALNAT